jgi:hypothetical protein
MSAGASSDEGSATLELLLSRARISDLVHRYANHIGGGRFLECRSLFWPRASFETRQQRPGDASSTQVLSRAEGIEAILAYIGRSAGGVCPMIHNLVIDISGDEAVGSSVMAATVWSSGQIIVGRYDDTFRREDGWRFASRTYTLFRA